jgi:peptidoglycan/LPS O-acetylase OafA/YrhL
VALFFVLSGFCIHHSFLRSADFNPRRFFWQRFWRIYPAYLAALLAFSLLAMRESTAQSWTMQLLTHALLIHNFSDSTFGGLNPSFWSIATEVQLYLGFPLLLLLRRRWGIEGCLVITFLTGLAWRGLCVSVWELPEHPITPAFSAPIMTWFDWTLGAYVAERLFEERTAFRRHFTWLLVLVPIFVLSTLCKPMTTFSFTLAAAISAVILDLAVRGEGRRGVIPTSISFIGIISYSIYLWHQPLFFRLEWWGQALFHRLAGCPAPRLVTAMLALASLVCLALLSYHFIERGGRQLGLWLWPLKPADSLGGRRAPTELESPPRPSKP